MKYTGEDDPNRPWAFVFPNQPYCGLVQNIIFIAYEKSSVYIFYIRATTIRIYFRLPFMRQSAPKVTIGGNRLFFNRFLMRRKGYKTEKMLRKPRKVVAENFS